MRQPLTKERILENKARRESIENKLKPLHEARENRKTLRMINDAVRSTRRVISEFNQLES